MSLADPDRWTRLFRWCALGGGGLAVCALAVAVIDPREGTLPLRWVVWRPNASEVLSAAVYGAAALAVVGVLAWRLRRSLAWDGDRPAAAVQLALLLPAVIGVYWAFWAGVHELLAFTYPLNEDLLTAGHWRVGGTIFGSLAGVALALLLLAGFGVARLATRGAARRERIRRWSRISRCTVLLVPLAWSAVSVVAWSTPLRVLACLGTTGLALAGVYAMQRGHRLPVWALAGGFGWGACVAIGFATMINIGYLFFAPAVLRQTELANVGLNLTPGIFEEAAKAAGIVLVFLLAGRRYGGVVSGLVIGASVGLGFNFVESIEYMSQGAAFQHWIRQVVGIMGAHTAFSALAGAGIGLAYQWSRPRIAGYAYLAAACGHFVNNYALGRLPGWVGVVENPYLWVLVVMPGALLVLQGGYVAMYVFVLRRGLREQAHALVAGARAEAWSGHGAITSDEVAALCSPRLGVRERIQALRRDGVAAYRRTARLHAAQRTLAMYRSGQLREEALAVRSLRDQILREKARTTVVPVLRAAPVGALP